MAEGLSLPHKDAFIVKPSKQSPITLRMVMVVMAMICGIYISSFCLKEMTNQSSESSIRVSFESSYLHYPQPQTYSRAECVGNPVRFFAIVSMQRSGSGWFEALLNSHVNLSSNGEIFIVKERRQNLSSIIQTLDKVYNLDWLGSASRNECSAAVGFKWMLNQGLMDNHEEIAEYFNRKGVSAVFLFRRNLLRRMVSLLANTYDRRTKILNGTHQSHVQSLEDANKLSSFKPFINPTSLVSDLREMESTASKALDYFNSTRHTVLYYEDLVQNGTKVYEVLDFLRLPRMELTSKQVKIHRGPIWEHIRNWDDVKRTLNGTEYESLLSADY